MNPQKSWSFVGLFMICLVLSMPFMAADALALTVQINQNSGEDEIPGYINAEGDIWTVEALVQSDEPVTAEDLKLRIGTNDAEFSSCTQTDLGMTCEYLSPLTEGITEGEFTFEVVDVKTGTPAASDVIRADGSGPKFSSYKAYQSKEDGAVYLEFTVEDRTKDVIGSGLHLIEVIDASTGDVVQSIGDFADGLVEYVYQNDDKFGGKLQIPLEGEGTQKLKLRATDRLGHTTTSAPLIFTGDFVKPVIGETLIFEQFGKFIGEFSAKSDLIVYVTEGSGVPSVVASSEQMALDQTTAVCSSEDGEALWKCEWENVEVTPSGSVSVTVTAKDSQGNSETRTLSHSFVKDVTPPVIEYFGSERIFQGKSYVASGAQRIILKVKDQGAGIDNQTGIKADLQSLGGTNSDSPNECWKESGTLVCVWETTKSLTSAGVREVGLSRLQDTVGNQPTLPRIELVVDNVGPKVEKLKLFGSADGNEKEYFQSNDNIKLEMTIVEHSGVVVAVDLSQIVSDADQKFPEDDARKALGLGAGWQLFTEADCSPGDVNEWDCELETKNVRSGLLSDRRLEIRVFDSAGNGASQWPGKQPKSVQSGSDGVYQIDILGLSTEDNPDYWEVDKATPIGTGFVDLDTTPLGFTRMPFAISFESENPKAKAVNVELAKCTVPGESVTTGPQAFNGTAAPQEESGGASPVISRSLLYGGVSNEGDADPKVNVVVEFEPFDGRQLFNLKTEGAGEGGLTRVPYMCTFKIFTKVDNTALQAAEVQEVKIEVPFGFSTLGALDENIDELIADEREAVETGFWGAIGVLNEIIKWLEYVVRVVQLVMGAINLVNALDPALTPAKTLPSGVAASAAHCFGMNTVEGGLNTGLKYLDIPIAILSCQEEADKTLGDSWIADWRKLTLGWYNDLLAIEIGKSYGSVIGKQEARFKPARSIKDNFFLSAVGLCVPGLVKGLDKLRNIKCRKIYCLENEVKAGLSTVKSCNALESLLQCKYFWGELWYLIPFSQLYDKVIGALWNFWKDPIALARNTIVLSCALWCAIDERLSTTCSITYYVFDWIDYLEQLAGFFVTLVEDISSGGLNYCDSVL